MALAEPVEGSDAILASLRLELQAGRERAETDRFANPIKSLAASLGARLASGELSEIALDALLRRLTRAAAESRAGRLRRYLGEVDEGNNEARLAELIRGLARGPDGAPVPWATFKDRVERARYGFVITAHPTFSLAAGLQRRLLALAAGEAGPADLAALEAEPHRPDSPVDLAYEHGRSLEVIRNLRAAIERLHGIAVDVAAELYPDEWTGFTPGLVTLASWVGYDTDGRADVPWTATFAKRLLVKLEQVAHYRERITAILARARGDAALASALELIEARLTFAMRETAEAAMAFEAPSAVGAVGHEDLARISRRVVESGASRLVDPRALVDLVDRAIGLAAEPGIVRDLVALRAGIATHGFGAAASHLRINALQLHNAIRRTLGMRHAPDDPSHRRSYLDAVAQLAAEVRPVAVNFGTVHDERASARRVFMTMAQMLKHVDSGEPLRFLIAECETAFTLVAALYFARLFGVDQRIDISPLFETRDALEQGVRVVEDALAVPVWRDYVRRRGRLCIETGYSDAGRYLGQLAAGYLIERLRLGLARALLDAGLGDVELVIFDTHGEGLGRGGHPETLRERLLYVDPPETRKRFAAEGIRHKEETSFQGGDGYLYFMSPKAALAVLTRAVEHALEPPDEGQDPFYADAAYVDEFFATVAQFNARVVDDPAYAALLAAFGTNLLYPSGSRPTKRQFDGTGGRAGAIEHPSQIRAIPHNSVLQQLGLLANTIGGLGQAVGKNPDRFQELYGDSPRFRRLMTMVEHAFMFTDLDVVQSYLDLFDPAFWLGAAAAARKAAGREEAALVAATVERIGLHDRLARILRVFARDHLDLAAALRRHRRLARDKGEEPIAVDPETRDGMHLLHALRLALIERIMRRAIAIPDFSDRHAATHDGVVAAVVQLEVEPALRLLREVFPLQEGDHPPADYGEPATYTEGGAQSYAEEHEGIFRPIAADYDRARRISSALVHHLGAVG